MANFQKSGKNVHGLTLPVPKSGTYELGLWGPIDTRNGTELSVSISPSNAAVKVKRDRMLTGQPVRVWQLTGLPVGRTLVEAKDGGGATWTEVTLEVAEGPKFTHSPNEVVTKKTLVSGPVMVPVFLARWSDLDANGARTLASQPMVETGGDHCFNWNLGNIKANNTAVPHMYLNGVWECFDQEAADKWVKTSGGQARIATEADLAAHKNWSCPGRVVVAFKPPNGATRFRAFASIEDGADALIAKHQDIASKNSGHIANLNAGKTDEVAEAIKKSGYLTGNLGHLKAGMKREKAKIDREMGPLP